MTYDHDQARSGNGFSLVEVVLVVSIVGLLALLSVPRIERALAARELAAARSSVTALWLRARVTAVQQRRPVVLTVSGGVVSASTSTSGGPVLVGTVPLLSEFGVNVTSPATSLTVAPTGLVLKGTPFLVRLARSGLTDSLRIVGYGRIE
jgi:prepilin-type N-terminal cleavage/methylation domain-containing protein